MGHVFSDWRALGCVYTSGREVVEREREREDEREAGMMLGGGEARVRLPMVALQSAMAVDRDAQRDGNAARRQEATRRTSRIAALPVGGQFRQQVAAGLTRNVGL